MNKTGCQNLSASNSKFFDIRCHLHTKCNLRCKFCSETKEKGIRENNEIDVDYINQLSDEITNTISPIMNRDGGNIISICLQGGEVFSDDIPDSLFDVYRNFLYDLENKLKKDNSNVDISVIVVSNGVYTNHKRIEDFLREFNARLTLSYDPIGRFANDRQLDTWINTFNYFKDKKEFNLRVSTVLTKKNIDAYINGDAVLEKIGNDAYIVNHEYVPRLDYHGYLASDDDIFNFYRWAIDNNKFNIASVDNILSSHKNNKPLSMCSETIDYIFDNNYKSKYQKGYINQCAENPLSKEEYYGEYADQIIDPNDCSTCKQSVGLIKRGCLLCEYYSKCPKMCWTQVLFDKYQMAECPMQKVYQYLEDNPKILVNYEEWENIYGKGRL